MVSILSMQSRSDSVKDASQIPIPPRRAILHSPGSPTASSEWLTPLPTPGLNGYSRLRDMSDIHPALRPAHRRHTETANPRPPRYVFSEDSDEEKESSPKGQGSQAKRSEFLAEAMEPLSRTPRRIPDFTALEGIDLQTPIQRYVPGNSWSEDAHRQRLQHPKILTSSGRKSSPSNFSPIEGQTASPSGNKKGKAPEFTVPPRRLESSNPYEARISLARLSTSNLREQAVSPLGSPSYHKRSFGSRSRSRRLKTARSLPVIRGSDEILWERPSPDEDLPEIPSFAYPLTSPIQTDSPSEPSRVMSSDLATPSRKVSFATPPSKEATQSEHKSRFARFGKRVLSWGKKNKESSDDKQKESTEDKKEVSSAGKKEAAAEDKKASSAEKKKGPSLQKKKSMKDLFKKASHSAQQQPEGDTSSD